MAVPQNQNTTEQPVLQDDESSSVTVEQQKISSTMNDYVKNLMDNNGFTKDSIIDKRSVVSEVQKFWPKNARWDKQSAELIQQINDSVQAIPTNEKNPSIMLRIAASSTELDPNIALDPQMSAVVTMIDVNDSVMRRYTFPVANEPPPPNTMGVPAGLMVICQPVSPVYSPFADNRPLGYSAGENLYSDRTKDKIQNGNDLGEESLNIPWTTPAPDQSDQALSAAKRIYEMRFGESEAEKKLAGIETFHAVEAERTERLNKEHEQADARQKSEKEENQRNAQIAELAKESVAAEAEITSAEGAPVVAEVPERPESARQEPEPASSQSGNAVENESPFAPPETVIEAGEEAREEIRTSSNEVAPPQESAQVEGTQNPEIEVMGPPRQEADRNEEVLEPAEPNMQNSASSGEQENRLPEMTEPFAASEIQEAQGLESAEGIVVNSQEETAESTEREVTSSEQGAELITGEAPYEIEAPAASEAVIGGRAEEAGVREANEVLNEEAMRYESIQPIEAGEVATASEAPETTEVAESNEPAEATEFIEPVEPIEQGGLSEFAAPPEPAEYAEIVEPAETLEMPESLDVREVIETTEQAETGEPAELLEPNEPSEIVEQEEIPELPESLETSEALETSEPAEPRGGAELLKPAEPLAGTEVTGVSELPETPMIEAGTPAEMSFGAGGVSGEFQEEAPSVVDQNVEAMAESDEEFENESNSAMTEELEEIKEEQQNETTEPGIQQEIHNAEEQFGEPQESEAKEESVGELGERTIAEVTEANSDARLQPGTVEEPELFSNEEEPTTSVIDQNIEAQLQINEAAFENRRETIIDELNEIKTQQQEVTADQERDQINLNEHELFGEKQEPLQNSSSEQSAQQVELTSSTDINNVSSSLSKKSGNAERSHLENPTKDDEKSSGFEENNSSYRPDENHSEVMDSVEHATDHSGHIREFMKDPMHTNLFGVSTHKLNDPAMEHVAKEFMFPHEFARHINYDFSQSNKQNNFLKTDAANVILHYGSSTVPPELINYEAMRKYMLQPNDIAVIIGVSSLARPKSSVRELHILQQRTRSSEWNSLKNSMKASVNRDSLNEISSAEPNAPHNVLEQLTPEQ